MKEFFRNVMGVTMMALSGLLYVYLAAFVFYLVVLVFNG